MVLKNNRLLQRKEGLKGNREGGKKSRGNDKKKSAVMPSVSEGGKNGQREMRETPGTASVSGMELRTGQTFFEYQKEGVYRAMEPEEKKRRKGTGDTSLLVSNVGNLLPVCGAVN